LPVITPAQIKAARELLGWSRRDLVARAYGVTANTVAKAEGERTGVPPSLEQIARIEAALRAGGIVFVTSPPGVRRRPRRVERTESAGSAAR
jgi:transcriptional regulator with XRE-family HTH domain